VTTTTYPSAVSVRRFDSELIGLPYDISVSFSPNRSIAVLLMHEALARARMREAIQATTKPGAVRPARLVAMLASKYRNRP
jgi:hypothetical protein